MTPREAERYIKACLVDYPYQTTTRDPVVPRPEMVQKTLGAGVPFVRVPIPKQYRVVWLFTVAEDRDLFVSHFRKYAR